MSFVSFQKYVIRRVAVMCHLFYFSYMKSDRVIILLNLCTALIVSYVIFLAGVDRTENKVSLCFKVYMLYVLCSHFVLPSSTFQDVSLLENIL